MVGWWIGNALGVAVLVPVVVFLANRVLRPAREATRYSADILEHGVGITAALEPVPALIQTGELVVRVRDSAVNYLGALQKLV
ncbi:MAG: hypothetical protein ACYCO3_07470 [Mycobacteriales bacterium]